MEKTSGSTIWLITLLTKTRTGITWSHRFFRYVHESISANEYDEKLWVQKFREVLEKNLPNIINKDDGFLQVKPDDIDWHHLFSKCLEMTTPSNK
jgi:hypothetical protein